MIVDPNLLQLIALGTDGDRYTPDGRHLRWFFERLLGFPRSGFRLRRRPSARGFDDPALSNLGIIRRQSLTRTGLAGPHTPGIAVQKQGGLVYQTAFSADGPALRVDALPVWLDFSTGAAPEPGAAEPSAYVLLTFARRSKTGRLQATGYYDTRGARTPRYRRVDRAAVGYGLAQWLDELTSAERMRMRGVRLRSLSEAGLHDNQLRLRDLRATTELRRRGLALRKIQGPPFRLAVDANPWQVETVVLHGGLLDRIEITGMDAVLYEVRWIPTRAYATAPGWEELERQYLPLTDAPDLYPPWSSLPGVKIAQQRVEAALPRARAPWDEPSHPPPPLTPAITAEIRADLAARHIDGEAFKSVDEAMRLFLKGESVEVVPQALVEAEVVFEPEGSDGGDPASFVLRPFDSLYAASVDPGKARALGLMVTDVALPKGAWDYSLDAGFPELWLRWVTDPEGAAHDAELLRAELGGRPIPWNKDGSPGDLKHGKLLAPVQILSLVTAVERGAVPLPAPPPDLRVDLLPRPLGNPVQTDAALSWSASSASLFESAESARLVFAVRRRFGTSDVAVHELDPDLLEAGRKAPIPHLPTLDAVVKHADRCRVVDATLTHYGDHEWRVSGMDPFGRFSPFASVEREVTDMVAPNPPLAVRAALEGSGPTWTLVVDWEWPEASATLAPDLARFEVHLRQGRISRAESPLPASWAKFEHAPAVAEPPLRVEWPSGAVTPPSGLVANTLVQTETGTTRLRLTVGPVVRAFDADHRAVVSVAVTAVDASGNTSAFGDPAIARRLAPVVPAPPVFEGELALSSLPDAAQICRFRVALPALDGGTAQVLRSPEITLRAAAALNPATWDALTISERVGHLKAAAVQHRELFSPDHAFPYDQRTSAHFVEIPAAERSWTVLTVATRGRTGAPSAWPTDPDRFVVVATRRPRVPHRPALLDFRAGNEQVTFRMAPDDSGLAAEFLLYRALAPGNVADVRRMRPVQSAPAGPEVVLTDDGLHADTDYWYRLVAVSSDGTRSPPTEPIRVRATSAAPPRPGQILSVERDAANASLRAVAFRIVRRDYPVYLFRRALAEPWAQLAQIPALTPDGTLRLSDLTATPLDGGFRYDVVDTVPDPDARYRYHVRVIDPRYRVADSTAVEEPPQP
jgi:hypothetical protein